MVRITQTELLKEAEAEEKNYNLEKAIELYQRVLDALIEKNDLENAAKINEKIGNVYTLAVFTAETKEQLIKMIENAVEVYDRALKYYKDTNHRVKELECRAGQYHVKAHKGLSTEYCKEMLINSFELYLEASDIYLKENDQINILRVLGLSSEILGQLLFYCEKPTEFKKFCENGDNIIERGWKITHEIANNEYIHRFLFLRLAIHGINIWTINTRTGDILDELPRISIERAKESLEVIDTIEAPLAKAIIYHINGSLYSLQAAKYLHDESKAIADQGIEFFEKAISILKKINIKPYLIHTIYWLDYFAALLGNFQYLQKRILSDIKDVQTYGKVYQNLHSFWGFLTNFISGNYYNNFAQRSFLGPRSRISYAKKGIKEIEDGLKKLSFGPFYAFSYQLLTNLYSELVLLTSNEEKREEFIIKMFESAHAAEKVGKNYSGGMTQAARYLSLYRAHRTLSYIVKNKKEKIKNLSAAIEATKENIKFSIESYRYFIVVQLQLGLLYEDLAILAKQDEPLFHAREIFLHLIKDTIDKGYSYYTAAAHEYLARIEDRLGNHLASAQQYEMASNSHIKSLERIQFKLLKDRVKEKIEYDKAWELIEKAKASHKKEDHLKAKEIYDKACEILKSLSNYNYEASYYSSWAFLEVSENASKNEEHQDAIDKFQITKHSFEKSINILKDALTQSSNKIESERITKLEKVANVRINYCLARINLEKARILQKQGEHLSAAENFALAGSQFRDICTLFKIERERKELEAIYHLCRAWEGMELAENYQEPNRFLEASNLFLKASNLFVDSKLKLLASGNSSVCLALENGCRFDESTNKEKKADYYKKVKMMLRNASSLYEKGGFTGGADWALGTSIYFDALWHLIKADEELELDNRKRQLEVGSKYLKSAADIFGKSGYKERQEEINDKINRIEREEIILHSALNTISNPVISRSTVGIVAPACPIESSLSPKISEVSQLTLEASGLSETQERIRKYNLIYKDLLKQYHKIQQNKYRIGIAQIGLSKSGDLLKELFEIKESGLLGIKNDLITQLRSTYKQMIEKANSNGVNVLIFPEMMVDLNYNEILTELMNFSKIYDMYIIPGSYHNELTKKNISIVISPEGILWEQEKHISATIHIGSKNIEEAIETSSWPRNTLVCNTEYGRMAIVICRDFLDMDLRVELKNFEPPVDVVINPAFTPVTADFKAVHFDARRSIYAYTFFANVADFGNSLIYTPEKERVDRNVPPKEEGLIYKDVDLFRLRSERKKWEEKQRKEKGFIQSTR